MTKSYTPKLISHAAQGENPEARGVLDVVMSQLHHESVSKRSARTIDVMEDIDLGFLSEDYQMTVFCAQAAVSFATLRTRILAAKGGKVVLSSEDAASIADCLANAMRIDVESVQFAMSF